MMDDPYYSHYYTTAEPAYKEGELDYRVGKNIRRLRLKEDCGQQDLADALEVPLDHVSDYEGGKRPVPAPYIFMLHNYLNCEIWEFYSCVIYAH
jgi:transcriptional regulator with XRE-family HTH domain